MMSYSDAVMAVRRSCMIAWWSSSEVFPAHARPLSAASSRALNETLSL
jgi:hypothetical protein